MQNLRKNLGNFGEQAAAQHLVRHGYRIVARQWRVSGGEIDLVARTGDTLVFVEVRTRRGDVAGLAAESISRAKQARMARLAYAYLEAHGIAPDTCWRIDVVTVDVDGRGRVTNLDHIQHAVEE